jgi:RES domain-containing protein
LRVYRLARADLHASLWSGDGGLHVDGRWHTAGRRIVYTAQSVSLAQLEVLVHISDRRQMPPRIYGDAEIPEGMHVEIIDAARLPNDWRGFAPYHPETQRLGVEWFRRQSSAVLRVPSAISPAEWNVLLNPAHAEFRRIRRGRLV